MSGPDGFAVDIDALRHATGTLRDSAESLRQQARCVEDHLFGIGDSEAGRNYSAQGMTVHRGLERLADWLRDWGSATSATATAFDTALAEYVRNDRERVGRTGG